MINEPMDFEWMRLSLNNKDVRESDKYNYLRYKRDEQRKQREGRGATEGI